MLRRAALLLAILALALPAPASGAPSVPGAVSGTAEVSTFYIVTGGQYFGGGAFEMNFACAGCYVRFTVTSTSVSVVENGAESTLAPGTYQIPGFAGYIGITTNGPNDFFLEIHGAGTIYPWSP